MSKELQTEQPNKWEQFKELVEVGSDSQKTFNDNALKLIFKKHIADLDSSYIVDYLHKAQLSGADPRLNQIFLVPKWDRHKGHNVGTVIWSYHFFMSVAESHKDFEGGTVSSEPKDVFDPLTGETKKQLVSTATVIRNGKPFTRSALWNEYQATNAKGTSIWNKKPYVMLEKCALSLAVRAAFPQKLNYIVTDAEMGQEIQDDSIPAESNVVIEKEALDQLPPEEKEIGGELYRFGYGPADIRNKLMKDVSVERLSEYHDHLDGKSATKGISERYTEIMTSIAIYLERVGE